MELKMLTLIQLKAAGREMRTTTDIHFEELVASIKSKGVLFPLIATAVGKSYEILDGRRRLKACRALGWKKERKLPVLLIKADKGQALESALIANIVRDNLDALGEAETVNLLINTYNRDVKDVAAALGKSDVYIRRLLKIYTLPAKVLASLRRSELTLAHAYWLSKLNGKPDLLEESFNRALKENLTSRDLETLVANLKNGGNYSYFSPRVVTTKAGSRLRFEPRRRSVRVELNINLNEPIDDVLAEAKLHLDKIAEKRLKAAS